MTTQTRSKNWRVRECPSCFTKRYASEFATLTYGSNWQTGYAKRRCPDCGHTGPTSSFRVVRDLRQRSKPTPARRDDNEPRTVGERMAQMIGSGPKV